jgi:hypothetical protein
VVIGFFPGMFVLGPNSHILIAEIPVGLSDHGPRAMADKLRIAVVDCVKNITRIVSI